MTKHFCDICKQPALDKLNVGITSTHEELSIMATVSFVINNGQSVPDLCDRCLATILENLHKKYTAVG